MGIAADVVFELDPVQEGNFLVCDMKQIHIDKLAKYGLIDYSTQTV